MQRDLYLVSYDVCDDAERVKLSRELLGYTVGRQKSVYECWLTKSELIALQTWVETALTEVDKVHIFKLPPSQIPTYLGTATSLEIAPIIIG